MNSVRSGVTRDTLACRAKLNNSSARGPLTQQISCMKKQNFKMFLLKLNKRTILGDFFLRK